MAENSRVTNLIIEYQNSDWGIDLVEVEVPADVSDFKLTTAVQEGIENFDSDVAESSQDMFESVMDQAMSRLGGSWHYARQAGTITIGWEEEY